MPPHELKLKEGCIVMLLRNLHATRGLCNGTRLRVEMIKKDADLHHCLRPPEADWSTRPHLPHPITVNKK